MYAGETQLDGQWRRVQPVRLRAELWLLYRQHAPGLAQICFAFVDGNARWRTGSHLVRALLRFGAGWRWGVGYAGSGYGVSVWRERHTGHGTCATGTLPSQVAYSGLVRDARTENERRARRDNRSHGWLLHHRARM